MRWIDIYTQKYDGSPLYRWRAELVDWGDDWLVWHAGVGTSVLLERSGTSFALDHSSISYVWLKRPYYVVADFGADGSFRQYYCNIVLPPRLDGSRLSMIDLDLDVLVDERGRTRLVDVGEFEANSAAMGYPPDIETLAWSAVAEIERMAQFGLMPFDGCLRGYLSLIGKR
jgi:protein associated with RNAse G/E